VTKRVSLPSSLRVVGKTRRRSFASLIVKGPTSVHSDDEPELEASALLCPHSDLHTPRLCRIPAAIRTEPSNEAQPGAFCSCRQEVRKQTALNGPAGDVFQSRVPCGTEQRATEVRSRTSSIAQLVCWSRPGTTSSAVASNPSVERTRHGMSRMALISFWAMRATPRRAAHLQR